MTLFSFTFFPTNTSIVPSATLSILALPPCLPACPRYIYQRMRSGVTTERERRRGPPGPPARMRRNVECISTQCIQFLVARSQPRGKQKVVVARGSAVQLTAFLNQI